MFDHLHATAFQHSSLGRTILGSADNVSKITKADLEEYIATHYTPSRMVGRKGGYPVSLDWWMLQQED